MAPANRDSAVKITKYGAVIIPMESSSMIRDKIRNFVFLIKILQKNLHGQFIKVHGQYHALFAGRGEDPRQRYPLISRFLLLSGSFS
jgi:hypothetical protein